MKDIQYQVKKKARAKTNPRSVISQEYHDFLKIFTKKHSYTLPLYRKYVLKIYLKKE